MESKKAKKHTAITFLRFLVLSIATVILLITLYLIINWQTYSYQITNLKTITSFIVLAISLILVSFEKRKAALFCASFALFVAMAQMILFYFGLGNPLEKLVLAIFPHFHLAKSPMPPNTILGVIVASLSLILIINSQQLSLILAKVGGALVTSLGIISLIGYASGLIAAYQWTEMGSMSIYSSTVFVILGIAILILAFVDLEEQLPTFHHYFLIIPLAIILLTSQIGLYFALNEQRKKDVKNLLLQEVQTLQKGVNAGYQKLQKKLEMFANSIVAFTINSANTRTYASSVLINKDTGFESIFLLDKNNEIKWQDSANQSDPLTELKEEIAKSGDNLKNLMPFTQRISLQEPHQCGFLFFQPVKNEGEPLGWLVGFLKDLQLFNPIFANLKDSGYYYIIEKENGKLLEKNFVADDLDHSEYYSTEINFHDATWGVKIWPSQKIYKLLSSRLPEMVLLSGLFFSSLMLLTGFIFLRSRMNEKRATNLEKRLETLINSSLDAIVTTNSEGTIVGWNEGAAQIFGYTKKEMIGQPITLLVPERFREEQTKTFENLKKSDESIEAGKTFETSGLQKNGDEFPIELSISKWQVNTEPYFTEIIRDISERKLLEESLYQSKVKAEHANKIKSEFLSRVIHEMRTPLTSILGFCELMSESDIKQDDFFEYAKTIKRNGKQLLNFVNNIIDINDLETGTIQIEKVKCFPKEIINELLQDLSSQAKEKGLSLSAEFKESVPEFIYSDPGHLLQVLEKVTENSIKNTQEGTIRIIVSLDLLDNTSFINFTITDSGSGIPAEEVGKSVISFFQTEAEDKEHYAHSSLALALAKKISFLMGGTISTYHQPEYGSTYVVRMPTHLSTLKEIEKKEEIRKNEVKETLRKDILVVDDNSDTLNLIMIYLKKLNLQLDSANDGLKAYNKAKESLNKGSPYHLILMDIDMPLMDGLEVTKKLREEGYSAPILALTALATSEEKQKCLEAGCDEVLFKPISREVLLEKIEPYIKE